MLVGNFRPLATTSVFKLLSFIINLPVEVAILESGIVDGLAFAVK
jgi:hypothetical protein